MKNPIRMNCSDWDPGRIRDLIEIDLPISGCDSAWEADAWEVVAYVVQTRGHDEQKFPERFTIHVDGAAINKNLLVYMFAALLVRFSAPPKK